ncbi:hypothetical protein P5F52_06190 [Clostridium perfringens]|uniref:hypothetical protein n=1 Tax=Clostridium perfringens TaxID=1502 RepID=UPI001C8449CF|nr:hypothetical protein [Clostridium perfringens]MDK0573163.1 hypothetical protein [Clostridium perfringens]MDK0918380.1 hypothetical protein [Clostridium perfringens]
MDELEIKTHSFEKAKNQLKIFSKETNTDIDLQMINSNKDTKEFFKDFFLGNGLGFSHKVTGEELNNLTYQIQENLIAINETQRSFIKEFGEVYNALEALDKDYIQAILIAVKSAQKANSEVKIAQGNIEKTIEEQKKIIKVLKNFKEKLDKYEHISNIDRMWNDIQNLYYEMLYYKKSVESLNKFKSQINEYEHLSDIDDIWAKSNVSEENLKFLNGRIEDLSSAVYIHESLLKGLITTKSILDDLEHLKEVDHIWEKGNINEREIKSVQGKVKILDENVEILSSSVCTHESLLKGLTEIQRTLNDLEHLKEIDDIWENVKKSNETLGGLSVEFKEHKKLIEILKREKEELLKQRHIKEIDVIWDSLNDAKNHIEKQHLKIEENIKDGKEQAQSLKEVSLKLEKYDSILHIFDLDDFYDDHIELKKEVEQIKVENSEKDKQIIELSTRLKEEQDQSIKLKIEISKKMRLFFFLVWGLVGLVVIEFILVAMGMI